MCVFRLEQDQGLRNWPHCIIMCVFRLEQDQGLRNWPHCIIMYVFRPVSSLNN
jgi:hypothetical protein